LTFCEIQHYLEFEIQIVLRKKFPRFSPQIRNTELAVQKVSEMIVKKKEALYDGSNDKCVDSDSANSAGFGNDGTTEMEIGPDGEVIGNNGNNDTTRTASQTTESQAQSSQKPESESSSREVSPLKINAIGHSIGCAAVLHAQQHFLRTLALSSSSSSSDISSSCLKNSIGNIISSLFSYSPSFFGLLPFSFNSSLFFGKTANQNPYAIKFDKMILSAPFTSIDAMARVLFAQVLEISKSA
jgi:hypothetical protein